MKYEKPPSTTPACGVWADLAQDHEMDFFYGAPLLVLIFQSRGGRTTVRDCSLAAGKHDVGSWFSGIGELLGRGWTYLIPRPEFLEEIKAPADHKLVAPLIFGYSSEKNLEALARKDDVILNWID